MKHLSDYVDPYIGSIGHLLTATQPLVHLPHSMAQIRPILDETITDRYLAPVIYGFPANKGSLMPDCGDEPNFFSSYDHDFECVKCYRASVLLEESGIDAEYTVTEHCAVYRFTYPQGESAHLRASLSGDGELFMQNDLLCGSEVWQGVPCCFAAEFSHAPEEIRQDGNALLLSFAPGICLEVKVGFSYIDAEQAADNLRRETTGLGFDAIAQRAQEIWDKTLGRIEVEGGTEQQKKIFYTSLYRVHQRMINISEYGRYYSAFDRKVHEDATDFYTNDGLWDTYRDAHPLQLLLEPARQQDIIRSYIRMYEQSGWMPSFPALQGSRAVMIGKHSTALIADAYAKGLHGFDADTAWEAMVKNEEQATKLPWAFGPINEFDKCYFEKGFFPALPEGETEWLEGVHSYERRQCVSVTLETAYDEWCLSQFAKATGRPDAESLYAKRAQNYKNLYNAETGFMSPKLADGSWVPNFDPKLSGGQGGRAYFAECNAWTYTLHVQHDIAGLMELMGGQKALESYLDRMFVEQYGTNKFSFLGQFPDETGLIGQFCMGNEPSFHIPYLYNYSGQPWKAQRKLREIMRLWFNDTPFGICGDEDGGAMCAWYVFSAMGFYPVCPGKPEYDIGSPVFSAVHIHLENGRTFSIRAEGNTEKTKYIQSASLNGEAWNTAKLQHEDILAGGELVLRMGERPNKEWACE
ncbi:MAG: GH92 family glycosyl hydrolase [Clostridia bacterium]|nr:GH92 family glycosyl hydrolase [Clostridia bacterium]